MIIRRISKFQTAIKIIVRFVRVDIWKISLDDLSRGKTFLITQLRILILASRGVIEDKVLLRAPALTFYSIFSIVPAVALAFGIAEGFGLEDYVERQLQIALVGREEVLHWVMEFAGSFLEQLHLHGGTLAAAGLALLLFSITMLLSNMEKSFNDIWQVSRGRPLIRKLSDYLAMILIAPVFFVLSSAATIFFTTQIQEISVTILSPLLLFLARLMPFILIWTVFTLLYLILPNTHVRFTSALFAGIVSGTAFQLIQWAYVSFQIGASTYSTMYGSFAAFPLLLVFMQTSWIVFLFGAELSFASHNVDNYEFESETKNISPFNRKILSLYILHLLVTAFQKGDEPQTPEQISKDLRIPNSLVRKILNDLEEVRLVNSSGTELPKKRGYQPAFDIHAISIKMALERLDTKGANVLIAKPSPTLKTLTKTLHEFYSLLERSELNKLIKDL